ncbi:MAG: hypothetical protein ABR608_05735 [Pseudonocardiaceae bacterium]
MLAEVLEAEVDAVIAALWETGRVRAAAGGAQRACPATTVTTAVGAVAVVALRVPVGGSMRSAGSASGSTRRS